MGRFLFWFILFLIGGGLALNYQLDIPWISSWLGQLPGDLLLKKDGLVIYFPITSSAIISLVFSILLSILFKKES